MADPIQFKYGITTQFRVTKCISTPLGSYLDIPAASDTAIPIEGSDTLVVSPEILLVTSGAFDIQQDEIGTITLHAGDLSSSQRYKSAMRIVTAVEGSSYVCLAPRKNLVWEREAGFVAANEQIEIETPAEAIEAFVYVAVGGLTNDTGDQLVGALVPVNGSSIFNATFDTYFLHVWRTA